MLVSSGKRLFIENSNHIVCYNYDPVNDTWLPYGANYKRGALKNGFVYQTQSSQHDDIGFTVNENGNVVVVHDVGTYDIHIYSFSLKTNIWKRIDTLQNVETQTQSSGSYALDKTGEHLVIYLTDMNTQGDILYYVRDNATGKYELKLHMENVSGILNSNSKRSITMSSDGLTIAIGDTNGSTHASINDNDDGVVKIIKIHKNDINGEYAGEIVSTFNSNNSNSLYGHNVSLNRAGTMLLVSEPLNHSFYVYIYDSETSTWGLPSGYTLTSPDVSHERLYNQCKFNANGDAFFASDYDEESGDDTINGIVYGFYLDDANVWQSYQTLSGDFFDPSSNDISPQLATDFSFTSKSNFGSIFDVDAQGTKLLLGVRNVNEPNASQEETILILKDPKLGSIQYTNLGLTPEEIVKLPLTPKELVQNSGLNTSQLREQGIKASQLIVGGKSETELFDNGFELGEIALASNDLSSFVEDPNNPVTSLDLIDVLDIDTLKTKGLSIDKILSDISNSSPEVISNLNYSNFKLSNVPASQLKSTGVSATLLRKSAYNATELVGAGFEVQELKEANLKASELKNAGVAVTNMDGIYEPEDIINANFDDSELENAGYSINTASNLTVNVGPITITQNVKTFTNNSNIQRVTSSLLSSEDMVEFFNKNPLASNGIEIKAEDASGLDYYGSDLSTNPVVSLFDFPDIDPTEEYVIVKYDEDTKEIFDPQPKGYPIKLTYNSSLNKYSASFTNLSLVSPQLVASAPDTSIDNPQVFFLSISSGLTDGGSIAGSRIELYLIFPRLQFWKASGNQRNFAKKFNTGRYNIKPSSNEWNNFTSKFELENCEILEVVGWNDPGIHTTEVSYYNHKINVLKQFKKIYDIPDDLLEVDNLSSRNLVGSNSNTNTIHNYHVTKLIMKAIEIDKPSYIRNNITNNKIITDKNNAINVQSEFNFTWVTSSPVEILHMTLDGVETDPTFYEHKYTNDEGEEISTIYTNVIKERKLNIFSKTYIDSAKAYTNNFVFLNATTSENRLERSSYYEYYLNFTPNVSSSSKTAEVGVTFPIGSLKNNLRGTNEEDIHFNYIFDSDPPIASLISTEFKSGDKTNANSVRLILLVTEEIRALEPSHFIVSNCGISFIQKNPVNPLQYFVFVDTLTNAGVDVVSRITLKSNSILDLAGNSNENESNTFVIHFDTISPTVLLFSTNDIENNQFYNINSVTMNVEFSEPIKTFTDAQINITETGTISNVVAIGDKGTNFSFVITPTDDTISSTISTFIPSGSIEDLVGNTNSTNSNTFTWNYDLTKPVVLVTSSVESLVSNDTFVEYTIQSSKNIGSIDYNSFYVSNNAQLFDLKKTRTLPQGGEIYTIKLSPLDANETTFYLKQGGIIDVTNNENDTSSGIFYWTYDGTKPIVSMKSTDISIDGTTNTPSCSVNISLSDSTLTISQNDLSFNDNITISDFIFDTSNNVYVVSVLVSNPLITNSLFIKSDAVFDEAGNGNNQSNTLTWFWNKTPPEITINSDDLSSNSFSNIEEIGLTISVSDAIQTLTVDNFNIDNGFITGIVDNGDNTFSCKLQPNASLQDGIIIVQVPSKSIEDEYGIKNSSPSNIFSWNFNNIRPSLTVTVDGVVSGETNNKTNIDATIEFSKEVETLNESHITVFNGRVLKIDKLNSTTYLVNIGFIPEAPVVKEISFYIKEGVLSDIYGNTNLQSIIFSWVSDTIPPAIDTNYRMYSKYKSYIYYNNVGYVYSKDTVRNEEFRTYFKFNKEVNISLNSFYVDNNKFKLEDLVKEPEENVYSVRFYTSNQLPTRTNQFLQGSFYFPPLSLVDKYGNLNDKIEGKYTFLHDRRDTTMIFYAKNKNGDDIETNSITNDTEIYFYVSATKPFSSDKHKINFRQVSVENGILEFDIATIRYTEIRFKLIRKEQNVPVSVTLENGFIKERNNRIIVKPDINTFYWTSDTLSPISSISSSLLTNGDITNRTIVPIDISFDEVVTLTIDDISMINCSYVSGSFSGSGTQYSFEVENDINNTLDTLVEVKLPDNSNVKDPAGNIANGDNLSWFYNNSRPKVISITSADVSNNGITNVTVVDISFTTNATVDINFDTFLYENCSVLNKIWESTGNTYYNSLYVDTSQYKNEVKLTIPVGSFSITADNELVFNDQPEIFTFSYFNHTPKIVISSEIENASFTNKSNIKFNIRDELNEEITLSQDDIVLTLDDGILLTDVFIKPGSFTNVDDTEYNFELLVNKDSNVKLSVASNSIENRAGIKNPNTSFFSFTVDTRDISLQLYSNDVANNEETDKSSVTMFVRSNKSININDLIANIDTSNSLVDNIQDVSPNNDSILFKFNMFPLNKNTDSKVRIKSDPTQYITDKFGNINPNPTDYFTCTFTGTNPSIVFIPQNNNIVSGSTLTDTSLLLNVKVFGDITRSLSVNDFNVENATVQIQNEVSINEYVILLTSIQERVVSSIRVDADTVFDAFNVGNDRSPTFAFGVDTRKPVLTISCNEVNSGGNSNLNEFNIIIGSSLPIFGLDVSDLEISGANINSISKIDDTTFRGILIPSITNGIISVNIPENICQYVVSKTFNEAILAPFVINYNNEALDISIDSLVENNSVTNDLSLNINVSFTRPIVSFNSSSIIKSSNYNLSLVSNVNNKDFTFNIQPFNNDYTSFKIPSNVFIDEFGNENNESGLFQWKSDQQGAFVLISSPSFTSNESNLLTSEKEIPVIIDIIDDDISSQLQVTDIQLSNASIVRFLTEPTNLQYTLTVSSDNKGSPSSIFIPGNVIFDQANNPNNQSNILTWTYDTKVPEAILSSPTMSSGEVNNLASIVLYIDTNEYLQTFKTSFLSLINCIVQGETISYVGTVNRDNKPFHRYECVIKFSSSRGVQERTDVEKQASIFVKSDVITNSLGFVNDKSNIFVWNYDGVAPILTIGSVEELDSKFYERDTLSCSISVVDGDDIDISINDITVNNGIVTSINKSSSSLYTFNVKTDVANTDTSVFIEAGIFSDEAGNSNAKSNVFVWQYDNKPLELLSLQATVENTPLLRSGKTNKTNIIVSVEFSEGVVGLNTSYIDTTNCVIEQIIPKSVDDTKYDLIISSESKQASIEFLENIYYVTNKFVTKYLSNSLNNSFNWSYNNVKPTISIRSSQLSGSLSNLPFIDLNLISSVPLIGFNVDNIDISGEGTLSNFDGSGNEYSVRFTPTQNTSQTIVISVLSNSIIDEYGNFNDVDASYEWIFDDTPVVVSLQASQPSGSTSSVIPYSDISISFNKDITGFTLNDIEVSNGTLSVPVFENNAYSIRLKPILPGITSILSIPINQVFDTAGNTNNNSITYEWTYSGTEIIPIITSLDISNGETTKNDTITININTGDSEVNTLSLDDLSIANGTLVGGIQSIDDYNWQLTVQVIQPNIQSSIFVLENSIVDSNLNNNIESNTFSWIYDDVLPTMIISSPDFISGTYSNISSLPLQFSVSEIISTFDSTIFDISNATLNNITVSNSDPKVFSATLVPDNSFTQGDITIQLPVGKINDSAGNVNDTSSNLFVWKYDVVQPVVTVTSNDVSLNQATDNSFVDLIIQVNKPILSLSKDSISVTNAIVVDLQGSSDIFTLSLTTSDYSKVQNVKVKVLEDTVEDRAGNVNETDSNEFKFTFNKEKTLKKDSDELTTLFQNDPDIPDEDILDQGAVEQALKTNVGVKDENGYTPLFVINKSVNVKIFKTLVDQIFRTDENKNKKAFRVRKTDIPLPTRVQEKLDESQRNSVVIAKSNQTIALNDVASNFEDEAIYVPLVNDGDFIQTRLLGNDGTLNISKLNETSYRIIYPDTSITIYDINTTPVVTYGNYTLFFGSLSLTYDPPEEPDEPPASGGGGGGGGVGDFIPCFLENTKILTTKGYKLIQDITPGVDVLLDDKQNRLQCLDVKSFTKQYDNVHFPYVVPRGAQMGKSIQCLEDLYLTYNHCIYIPHSNKYVPSYRMNLSQDKTRVKSYTYYHVFTENFFCDVIIANGIPCETHGKYVREYIQQIDKSGKLMKKVLSTCNAQNDGTRLRMNKRMFNNIVKKFTKKRRSIK
jgi:hypothetical protein